MTEAQVRAAAKAGTEEALADLKVSSEQHLLDHVFVAKVRKGIDTTRKGSLLVLGGSIVTAIGYAIKTWFSSLSSGGTP